MFGDSPPPQPDTNPQKVKHTYCLLIPPKQVTKGINK
jgi:hypothetical protein